MKKQECSVILLLGPKLQGSETLSETLSERLIIRARAVKLEELLLSLFFALVARKLIKLARDASRGGKWRNWAFPNIGVVNWLCSATYNIAIMPNEWGHFAVP